MKKKNLTPWFDGSVKPARVGIYQRDYYSNSSRRGWAYCRWDGYRWYSGHIDISYAFKAIYYSPHQELPWRGIAK